MQAILITYDQAHHEGVVDALTKLSCRGFTAFGNVQGRGSNDGEPHYGSHAWPGLGEAIISVVEDDRVDAVLGKLRELDQSKPLLGLRAFVWPITKSI